MIWTEDMELEVRRADYDRGLKDGARQLLPALIVLVEHFERVDGDERHKAVIAQASAAIAWAETAVQA